MELTDAEMNAIYDEFEEDYQKADLEEVLKDLAFHNASQARYTRNAQVHPVACDILAHQAWKELEEKARYYVEIMGIGNTSLLTEEELQEYNDVVIVFLINRLLTVVRYLNLTRVINAN